MGLLADRVYLLEVHADVHFSKLVNPLPFSIDKWIIGKLLKIDTPALPRIDNARGAFVHVRRPATFASCSQQCRDAKSLSDSLVPASEKKFATMLVASGTG